MWLKLPVMAEYAGSGSWCHFRQPPLKHLLTTTQKQDSVTHHSGRMGLYRARPSHLSLRRRAPFRQVGMPFWQGGNYVLTSSQCRSNELAIHSYRQRKATRHEPYKQAPPEANLVLIIF